MKMYGSQSFIEEAIRISVEKNLGITFTDPAQEKYRQEYAEQLREKKLLQQKGQQFSKDAVAQNAAIEAAAKAAFENAARAAEAKAAAERQAQVTAAQRKAAAKVTANTQKPEVEPIVDRTATAEREAGEGQGVQQWKRIEPATEHRPLVPRSLQEIEKLQAAKKAEDEKKKKITIPQPGGRRKKRDDTEQDR